MSDAKIKAAFAKYDKDGNGTIDQGELKAALNNVEGLKALQLAVIMSKADIDENKKIDFKEFKGHVAPEIDRPPTQIGDVKAAFAKYDTSGDGFLGPEEIIGLAIDLKYGKLTLEQAKYLVSICDDNKDNKISFDEFSKLVK